MSWKNASHKPNTAFIKTIIYSFIIWEVQYIITKARVQAKTPCALPASITITIRNFTTSEARIINKEQTSTSTVENCTDRETKNYGYWVDSCTPVIAKPRLNTIQKFAVQQGFISGEMYIHRYRFEDGYQISKCIPSSLGTVRTKPSCVK